MVARRMSRMTKSQGEAIGLLVYRHDRLSAIADVTWSGEEQQEVAVAACRELVRGLRADAVGLVVDTRLLRAAETAPPDVPAAGGALCSYCLLATGDLTVDVSYYDWDIEGRARPDVDASGALDASDTDPRSIDLELLEALEGVLDDSTGEIDVGQVRAAAQRLEGCGCRIMWLPHVLAVLYRSAQ